MGLQVKFNPLVVGNLDLVQDVSGLDHGGLSGLSDDDHTQYSLISSQSGAPSSTPSRVGEVNIDTDNDNAYIATGTASSADWTLVNDDTNLTQEAVEDFVGAMVTGNTETLISVTYDDVGGKLDFVVDEASIDHGALSGLGDDDHTQYLLASGTRALSGNWDAGTPTVTIDDLVLDVSLDAGSASDFEIPNSTSPTVDTDGQIAIDTSVTDFSHGILKYYSGEEMAVVAMPIAELTSPTDGHVVAYNATNDEFELVSSAGGSSEWTDTGTVLHPTDSSGTLDNVVIGGTTAANSDHIFNVNGSWVLNEQGLNVDGRIEGNTNVNLFYVDASADSIGIGTSSPKAVFDVQAPAVASAREDVLNVQLQDEDTTSRFFIANSTTTDNLFVPQFTAFATDVRAAMIFRGYLLAADDLVSTGRGVIRFTAAITDDDTDPNNGSVSAFSNHNIFTFENSGTNIMRFTANNDVEIPADNKDLQFGAAQDAVIFYNGTNLLINPKLVGSGLVNVLSELRCDSIVMDSDVSGGAGTNTITGSTDTPTTDPGWTSSSTVDMNAPDAYIKAYNGTQAIAIPFWNT